MNPMKHPGSSWKRRDFLTQGTLMLTAASVGAIKVTAAEPAEAAHKSSPLRIGLVTDLHHADKPTRGTRHYRETLRKLEEAGNQFAAKPLDCLVELGDLIDAADTVETELSYLRTVDASFSMLCPNRHYVLGNHCVDTLTKDEFLSEVGQQDSFYSFDLGGFHFIVLDACFRSDGVPYGRNNSQWTDANLSQEEVEWLTADLKSGTSPVVVFTHQRLDVTDQHSIRNHEAVRGLLEESGRVSAVFQGHSHQNDLQVIGGIPYCTLVAMVEGSGEAENAYSVLEIEQDGTMRLSGFRKQQSRRWDPPASDSNDE